MAEAGATLLQVFKERDIMAVAAVVEGIQFMLQDAARGDPGAKLTLSALVKALRAAEDLESPLTVVRHPND
jgi:hypothetical protein